MQSWRTWLTIVGAYALVLVALFWRVWFRGELSGWDCAVEYWPDLVFAHHSLAAGEWPLWNPYALGGYPFWADPQTGLYSPIDWLLWLGAAIGGDGPWLVQAKVLGFFLIGMTGMHAWTWRRTRSHVAAAVATLTFVVGGPVLVHKNSAILWPLFCLPWLLVALERFAERPSPRRGAVVAAALWILGTSGSPPGCFYALLVAIPYAIYLAVAHRVAWRRAPLAIAIATVIAGLLLAATWLPARDAVAESPRAERGAGYVLSGSMRAGQLDELLVPDVDRDWQADIYVGALPLVGAAWLLIAGRRRARTALWIAIGAAGVVLALGAAGHVLPHLVDAPGFSLFRIAYRYKLVFAVAAAALAGDAIAGLGDDAPPRARWVWLGLGVAWLLAGAVVQVTLLPLVLSAAIFAIGALALWRPTLRVALVLVPALVFADLWSAGASKLAILMKRPGIPAAPAALDASARYVVTDASSPYGGTVPYQVAFLYQLREMSGYPNPIERRRHREAMAFAKQQPEVLGHLNVGFVAAHGAITPVADVAPLARWYGAAEVVPDAQVLARLAAIAPSAKRAVFVPAPIDLPASDAAPVDATVVRYARNRVVIDVDAPAPGVLVLADGYASGWEAEVNGEDANVFRADDDLRAVLVPAGHSRVVFAYRPRGWIALPLLFLAGLLGLVLTALPRWRWLDGSDP